MTPLVLTLVSGVRMTPSIHQFAGDALGLHGDTNLLEQLGLGAVDHAVALDVAGGVEAVGADEGLLETLALEVDLQGTEVADDDALAGKQIALEILTSRLKDGSHVGSGGGGGMLDVLLELIEGVVAGLDGEVSGVVHASLAIGVDLRSYLIGYTHSSLV